MGGNLRAILNHILRNKRQIETVELADGAKYRIACFVVSIPAPALEPLD